MKHLELKVPPPIVGLIFACLMWAVSNGTNTLDFEFPLSLVVILVSIGVCFDVSALLSFRKARTTINPLKPASTSLLVTTGVYRITRNPMYVGLVFFLLAWGMYLGSILSLVCVPPFIAYLCTFQIFPEERILEEKFGSDYLSYKNSVRRWL
ncbi:MAG: isoprenylcysteine carboxylmethyltransferase family protein [Pseudomonadota bacterium]